MTVYPSTFSIAAYDPDSQEWGVAVASKFLAVGSAVPFGKAGVGVIATQAEANTSFGPLGLNLLMHGYSAEEALGGLLAPDAGRQRRQVGIVDKNGKSATYTGTGCFDWAGGRAGNNYATQGNILASAAVVEAIADCFEGSRGTFADRLLRAIAAGQEQGGDRRGQQSAALLVVKEDGGYGGFSDRYIDLRVDDHQRPIEELQRLLKIHQLFFAPTRDSDVVPIDQELGRQLINVLNRAGQNAGSFDYENWSPEAEKALQGLFGTENLEERWIGGDKIDRVALEYLSGKYLD